MMSVRPVVALAAAVLPLCSVALKVVASGTSQGEPELFSAPFDDFDVDEPSERMPASESEEDSLTASSLSLGKIREGRPRDKRSRAAKSWAPPTRNGSFPFAGPMPSLLWDNRLLIAQDRKFAFCYIEKNACTQFNLLVNGMNGMPTKDPMPFWKSNSDGVYKEYFKTHSISKADNWSISIFVRDPAERFLSAWLSKCDA
ncbi:unnamed protein product [Prorocentrum cordatum]|uniref:Secreted protein n=1 Tax=Prorocentrum cordatum TaxID=2364126 RepID=A0ABN9UWI7_9DINO|nr:unnamed protein product [Polarella glacialis]